jgi:MAF protein
MGGDVRNIELRGAAPVASNVAVMLEPTGSLLLASASPRRRELLGALGLTLRVVPAHLDEAALGDGLPPERAAITVASAKASAVAGAGGVVLAADTMVVLDGWVLGKPASSGEAYGMLAALRGRAHDVITAVVVRADGETQEAVRRSTVRMRAYRDDEIAAYVATGSGLDKAGAYGIQEAPFRPVEAIEGCWCNVMGLPLWTAVRLLRRAGCPAPRDPAQVFARCATCPLVDEEPA